MLPSGLLGIVLVAGGLAAIQGLALCRAHCRNAVSLSGRMPSAVCFAGNWTARGAGTLRSGQGRRTRHHRKWWLAAQRLRRRRRFIKQALGFFVLCLEFSNLL